MQTSVPRQQKDHLQNNELGNHTHVPLFIMSTYTYTCEHIQMHLFRLGKAAEDARVTVLTQEIGSV